MAQIQNVVLSDAGVMPAMRSAGVRMKTAPTSMSSTTETMFISWRAVMPSSRPMISGSEAPSPRIDIMPDMKSWTAPAKIVPATIQMNAAGPNLTPMMAPKIGPRPAMLRNCIRKTFHVGSGRKSTPSYLVSAGIFRLGSTPKTRAQTRL